MKFESKNSFKSLDTLNSSSKNYKYFNLKIAEKNGLEGISKLPKSLKVLGSSYLLYMAYKLSFGGQTKDKKLDPKPVTFINTFFFQFVNPKSIIVGLTSISLFVDTENNYLRDSIVLTILWFLMAVGSQTGWCLMGKYMRKFATSDKFIKNFNYTMSFLLIVCVILFYV